MREANFQSEWTHSINTLFKNYGKSYYKIPDMASKGGFTAQKPYDNQLGIDNHFFAFELKQMKKLEGFAFNRVEDHQIMNLLKIESVGENFHGYIVINYRKNSGLSEKQKEKYNMKKLNISVIFTIDEFLYLKNQYNDVGKKSIPFKDIIDIINKFWIYSKKINVIEWEKIEEEYLWDIETYLQNNHQICYAK